MSVIDRGRRYNCEPKIPSDTHSKKESVRATRGVNAMNSTNNHSSLLARLSKAMRNRLRPSQGTRPGRPSDPAWSQYGKIPMSKETSALLSDIAARVSADDRRISPMQVAAHMLEVSLKKYSTENGSASDSKKCA